jgi:sec-independent protein translocase protein TatA
MFDIGGGEVLLILVFVLLMFGPKKIPEVMASVGKGIRKFRQAQDQLKQQLRDMSAEIEQATDVPAAPKKTFTVVASSGDEEPQPTTDETINTSDEDNNTPASSVIVRQPEGIIARTPIARQNSDTPSTEPMS